MRCEAVRDELAAFLDGELSAEEGATVLAHLETCGGCRDEKAVLERTRERVRSLPRVVAPVALLAGVATRLAEAAGRGPCPQLPATELSAFLDNQLEAAARERVVAHLETCPSCRGDLVALDSVVSGVQNLPRIPAPEILAAIVRERIALLAGVPGADPREGRLPRRSSRSSASPTARPVAPPPPRVPREPIQIPLPVKRFIAAASIVALALLTVPAAAVNGSAAPQFLGDGSQGVSQNGRSAVAPASPAPSPEPLPKPLERERTLFLVADATVAPTENIDAASWTARNALTQAGVDVGVTRDPAAFVLRGSAGQIRSVLTALPPGLTLEDSASLDVLLPPPLDRVFGRNGEVYAGTLVEQDARHVLVRAGELEVDLPARSCVRVERASAEPVEVGLLVRRKRLE